MASQITALPTHLGDETSIAAVMTRLGNDARLAADVCAHLSSENKIAALNNAAKTIRAQQQLILQANRVDLAHAVGQSDAYLDRLQLTRQSLEAIAHTLEVIAQLPDPTGQVLAHWQQPNGLHIARVSVPLGVIGMIYESRPNVTAEAAALALKSGNAVILRCGSDSFHSCQAIAAALTQGFQQADIPTAAVQLVPTTSRSAVQYMLTMSEAIDVLIPRGSRALVEHIVAHSKIPVLQHLDGICHIYADRHANPLLARDITLNAKMRRPSICGAAETLLVDQPLSATLLPQLVRSLLDAHCQVRGDQTTQLTDPRVLPASDDDYHTEYLDAIISVKVVDGVDQAIRHINHYGSHHTDAIITEHPPTAEHFLNRINSSIVLWNASTQFADGGEFGMGGEIGIATGKLHARGPVGAEQLTTYKYIVRGHGQVRA